MNTEAIVPLDDSFCIRHPWGIVPALALCGISLSFLYQKCTRFAKIVDKILH